MGLISKYFVSLLTSSYFKELVPLVRIQLFINNKIFIIFNYVIIITINFFFDGLHFNILFLALSKF